MKSIKTITKKTVLKISTYLLVLLVIILFLVIGDKCQPAELIPLSEIDSVNVEKMVVTANGKKTLELSKERIDTFLELVGECSTPLELRKMRVMDKYTVQLKVGNKIAIVYFYKKNMMPFMMNKDILGETYECQSMEDFLGSYK
jgi:hypothetical protein